MTSPIQTGGFGVNVMPQLTWPDLRMLAPNYNILPAVQQGMQFGQQLKDIPIQEQLRQISVPIQQTQLANQKIALARAMMPIEDKGPIGYEEQVIPEVQQPLTPQDEADLQQIAKDQGQPAADAERAKRLARSTTAEQRVPYQTQEVKKYVYNPATNQFELGETKQERTKIVATPEQQALNESLMQSRADAATARQTAADAAAARAQAVQQLADVQSQMLELNQRLKESEIELNKYRAQKPGDDYEAMQRAIQHEQELEAQAKQIEGLDPQHAALLRQQIEASKKLREYKSTHTQKNTFFGPSNVIQPGQGQASTTPENDPYGLLAAAAAATSGQPATPVNTTSGYRIIGP